MNRELIKFGIVGITNTAIDFILLNLFLHLGLSLFWAIFCAYMIGSLNGYLLNNKWTYKHLAQKNTVTGFVSYAAISFIGLGLTEIIVYLLFNVLRVNVNIDKLVAVLIVFAWNFLANRFFTFKKQ